MDIGKVASKHFTMKLAAVPPGILHDEAPRGAFVAGSKADSFIRVYSIEVGARDLGWLKKDFDRGGIQFSCNCC